MEIGQGQVVKSGSSRSCLGATTFPRFLHLPGELQWHIWFLFCPETVDKPFLLSFIFDGTSVRVCEGDALSRTTAASRALLAVHRDSRQFALKALPDTLTFREGEAVVRFRRERDVVVIVDVYSHPDAVTAPRPYVPGFSDSVVNLLMPCNLYGVAYLDLYRHLPNLRVLYQICGRELYNLGDLAWCFSASTHHSKSLNVPSTTIYWPDIIRHREYAEENIPSSKFPVGVSLMGILEKINLHKGVPGDLDVLTHEDRVRFSGIRVWPMVTRDFTEVWRPGNYHPPDDYTIEKASPLSPPGLFTASNWIHPTWSPPPWEWYP